MTGDKRHPAWQGRTPGLAARQRWAVALGFSAFIVIGTVFSHWRSGLPTVADECVTKCATHAKTGTMVYRGPDTSKTQYKDTHSDCECR